jgi:hypothetical protein
VPGMLHERSALYVGPRGLMDALRACRLAVG